MINKKTKKLIAIAIACSTTISIINSTTTVFAATKNTAELASQGKVDNSKSVAKKHKSNLKILDSNFSNYQYTYDREGTSYKVSEKFNDDLTDGQSNIYVKNKNGEYELDSTIKTTKRDGKITFTTTDVKNNATTTETLDLDLEKESNTKSSNLNVVGISRYSDSELTDWQYNRSTFGSNKIWRYTIVGVTSAICGVIGAVTSALSAGASALVAGIVSTIVSDEIPVVYYGQDVYYKFLLGTDPPLPRAERSWTSFYSDSRRNNKIGDTVLHENYSN